MKYSKIILSVICVISLALCSSCSDSDCVTCPDIIIDIHNTIEDLSIGLTDYSSIVITWTAPDTAIEYDIRYSLSPIDSSSWATATQFANEPTPQAEGKVEIVRIDGLEANTDYYFAVKYSAETDVWSVLSNVVQSYTSVYNARGKIVFSSMLDGDAEIFVMDSDGSNMRQITTNIFSDGTPIWTISGTGIIFSSDRGDRNQLYSMDYDGKNQINISNNAYSDSHPSLNSSGNSIAYLSWADSGLGNIYTCDIDGTGRTWISQSSDTLDIAPDWSPDGTKIAFSSIRAGTSSWAVFTMDLAGSNVTLLADAGSDPAWSPDGTKIAYTTFDDLYIMDADGSNKVKVTNHGGDVRAPDWSPDGTKLVFTSNIDGDAEVYTINIDGTNELQLTHNSVSEREPSWSPVQ